MKLVLEPRYLFDGSVAPVTKPVVDAHHETTQASDALHADSSLVAEHGIATEPVAGGAGPTDRSASDTSGIAANPNAKELIFVDPRVANWRSLIAGASVDAQVVLIDPSKSAIDQVSDALADRSGVTAIHFLSYGEAGQANLGSQPLNAASVAANAGQIAGWTDHLAPNADIMFWGCDVGRGAGGQALLADLHTLTGAAAMSAAAPVGRLCSPICIR